MRNFYRYSILIAIVVVFLSLFVFIKNNNTIITKTTISNSTIGTGVFRSGGIIGVSGFTGNADAWDLDLLYREWLDVDASYKEANRRYKNSDWKNFWDYTHLTYTLNDLWKYDQLIEIWNKAIDVAEKNGGIKSWAIDSEMIGDMVEAYLYKGDIKSAEALLDKFSFLSEQDFYKLFFEKIILAYKKWDYKFIIDNSDKIKNEMEHFRWWEYLFLYKIYSKRWDIDKQLYYLNEIYTYGDSLEKSNQMLSTMYWYVSTLHLKDIYLKQGNNSKADFFNKKYTFFKDRIDNWEAIKYFNDEDVSNKWFKLIKERVYFNINRFDEM